MTAPPTGRHTAVPGGSIRTANETQLIAGRLAAASQWFRLPHNDVDGRAVADSVVYVEAEGSFVTATVTDFDGSKTEYRAEFRPINECAPGVAATTAEGGSNNQPAA
jgi:hypothetical protein